MAEYRTAPDPASPHWPKGIPYIIGNEGCERFSYYGMKAILFVYLSHLMAQRGLPIGLAEHRATEIMHTFNAAVYALPLVGAMIADRLFGKYRTILWLSLVYCAGHACLAIFERNFEGFAFGLALIALGAGGIKPCVSAHVGDQFGKGNFHLVERVFQLFYFIINFGALSSTLVIPVIKERFGFSVAFAVPGLLMGLATAWFWMGRRVFVHVPPDPGGKWGLLDASSGVLLFLSLGIVVFGEGLVPGYESLSARGRLGVSVSLFAAGLGVFAYRQRRVPDDGFLAVLLYCARYWLTRRSRGKPSAGAGAEGGRRETRKPAGGAADPWRAGDPSPGGEGTVELPRGEGSDAALPRFFEPARARFGLEAAEGPAAVLRILSVFAMVSVFWALFDQNASSWVAQAREMDRELTLFGFSMTLMPEQIQAANPALVMLMVPFMGYLGYPLIEKVLRVRMTPLRRMSAGMFVASASFVIVALAQARLDRGEPVHVGVQLVAFVVLTMAEVMVSVTGLEFAYTQAPRRMKSLLMGFWLLTASLGNVLVAAMARLERLPREQFFWLFAQLMLGAAVVFTLRAAFYRYRTYTQ